MPAVLTMDRSAEASQSVNKETPSHSLPPLSPTGKPAPHPPLPLLTPSLLFPFIAKGKSIGTPTSPLGPLSTHPHLLQPGTDP